MNSGPQDELSLTLQRFVDWGRQQGWLYQMVPSHLRQLEHFLRSRRVRDLGRVNSALLGEYQRCLAAHDSPLTVNGHLNTWRALWRYLLKEGLVAHDATGALSSLLPDTFVPHLYSAQELSRIQRATSEAIRQVDDGRERFSRQTQHAAFGLLRDAGLRVSEACRLDVNHFDPGARTLCIERTKFLKTRLIPLGRSTCILLKQYLKHRHRFIGDRQDKLQALFVSTRQQRLSRSFLKEHFQQLLRELGLWQSRRRQGRTVFGATNLHALRHSFAVRTLERWHLQGRDVERLLPLLSGYMGHVRLSYTKRYLHLTPTLRLLASQRFAELVLPQLDRRPMFTDDELQHDPTPRGQP